MPMFEHFGFGPLITAPAIWGRLPSHSDRVCSGMRIGEDEAWRNWLAMQGAVVRAGGPVLSTAALPTVFVLPPGSLSKAIQRFAVGVIVPSMDGLGRRHVLIVYQLAALRWVNRHFVLHAQYPCDWLFWLCRALSRHVASAGAADVWTLARAVDELWQIYAPACTGSGLWRRQNEASSLRSERMQAMLECLFELPVMKDPSAYMMGARHLPWPDWPQCLQHQSVNVPSAFWQQDAHGGFVNAARRLDMLWSDTPT